ncbi:hypothetical protein [Pseudomonas nitroreducens]|uniref:hypothetical protein n=1 Tax=Pseudomonas nitroreducens TaxID=46680 RepID=UPI0020924129
MYPIGKWTCAALLVLAGSVGAAERTAQPCDDATLQTLAGLLGQQGWQAPESAAATPVVAAACKAGRMIRSSRWSQSPTARRTTRPSPASAT